DGLKDNLISDPMSCSFDPVAIACEGADSSSCLTKAQVVAARKIYANVTDPKTGKVVAPGLEPGSEPQWGAVAANEPHPMDNDLLRFIVHQDPKWTYRQLDIATDLERARKADGGVHAATSTDLAPC